MTALPKWMPSSQMAYSMQAYSAGETPVTAAGLELQRPVLLQECHHAVGRALDHLEASGGLTLYYCASCLGLHGGDRAGTSVPRNAVVIHKRPSRRSGNRPTDGRKVVAQYWTFWAFPGAKGIDRQNREFSPHEPHLSAALRSLGGNGRVWTPILDCKISLENISCAGPTLPIRG
jgi:hypothetical protein